MPKLIFFDLDGTLTESKQPLSDEMAGLLAQLLERAKVVIVSGGALPQFLEQVVGRLPADAELANLYIEPTSGAALYEYRNGQWDKIYEERISEADAAKIEEAMREGAKESGVIDPGAKTWGPQLEYRGGQVTFSALGQKAPPLEKKAWDPTHAKRQALQKAITPLLPAGYTAAMGGATTIDVTKNGIDKAYGLRQLCKRLGIEEADVLYVGDELRALGNDEAVFKTEAKTHAVDSTEETATFIRKLLAA